MLYPTLTAATHQKYYLAMKVEVYQNPEKLPEKSKTREFGTGRCIFISIIYNSVKTPFLSHPYAFFLPDGVTNGIIFNRFLT